VYRIDTDGTVVEVTHECEKPNGVALSPDEKILYVVDHNNGTDKIDPTAPAPKTGAMKLYAFPLNDDGLVAGKRKTLLDFGKENGIDGMTVDTQGNLYLAVRDLTRPGIMVTNPAGKEIAFIPTGPSQAGTKDPKGIPSNVEFGIGDEANVLYVTIDTSLYRIPLKTEGYHIPWAKK
jgi:gluconolactonase